METNLQNGISCRHLSVAILDGELGQTEERRAVFCKLDVPGFLDVGPRRFALAF